MSNIQRTLPASWYTSPKINALERRAVFLRSWYFVGTVTKFRDGRDVDYEISQVRFIAKTTTDPLMNGGLRVRTFESGTVSSSTRSSSNNADTDEF